MAKVLTTKQSAAALEDILRKAKKEIYLISFSFIISDTFITRIRQAVERGIIVNMVYGKSIRRDSYDQLITMPNLNIYFRANMHAKVFANETKCVIGSMNFSEASENNNIELGVLLSAQNDAEAYGDAMTHCKELIAEKGTFQEYHPKVVKKPIETVTPPTYSWKNAVQDSPALIVAKPPEPLPTQDFTEKTNVNRLNFVTKILKDNYGTILFDADGYGDLAAYNVKVYLNEYRIDFIFGDNPRYEPKRKLLEQLLGKTIRERFWVNRGRVNIEALTNEDLIVVIREVMRFTLVHLI